MKVTFSPSVLAADLMHMADEVRRAESWGVEWLHLDEMDGHFVPNISFGPESVAAIRKATDLFLDVHLMLSHPMQYIEKFAKAGADLITIHVEADDDPAGALRMIRSLGVKTGISIKPATDPEAIRHLLPLCDLVLVMTVEPGFGGQSLREDCVQKIPALRNMLAEEGLDQIRIEVDGGVNAKNAAGVIKAGADVLVMGTGLFHAENPVQVIESVLAEAGEEA